jgi:hypothetical protein
MPLLHRELHALSAERLGEMSAVLAEIQALMYGEEAP